MKRSTVRETSDRVVIAGTRTTLDDTNDEPLMQEVRLRGFHAEKVTDIEHAQPYGFTARPKKPTEENGKKRRAEAFVLFLNGARQHGVAVIVADRRFRPNNLDEGEVVNHDDQLQQVYISRDRIVVHSDKEVHVQRKDAHALLTDGKHKLQYADISVTMKGGKVYLGAEGKGSPVLTEAGPSKRVFAVIDETDGAMQAAKTAKRTVKQQQQQPQAKK